MIRPLLAFAFLTTALVSLVHADTLLIQRSETANAATTPRRGALKAQVEAQFGAPEQKHAAVGKPPITRWDYPSFSVYFEYDHVIDAVLKKSNASEIGVKPVAQPKNSSN